MIASVYCLLIVFRMDLNIFTVLDIEELQSNIV